MKNLFLLLGLLLFISCDLFNENDDDDKKNIPDPLDLGESRTFWAVNDNLDRSDPNYFYQLTAVFVHSNESVNVFVENTKTSKLNNTEVTELADQFKNNIQKKVTSVFGASPDFDENGKVTILLLDIKDAFDTNNSGGFIAGYFHPNDLLKDEQVTGRSNEQEILYIDCEQQNINSSKVYSTIAHEYQHMIHFYQRHFVKGIGFNSLGETWLQEALAEQSTFEVYGQNGINDRFNFFGSSNYNKTHSLIHWQSSLTNYSLAATYMNFVSNKFENKNQFLKDAQYQTDGGEIGLSSLLTVYTGTGIEKFKQSFRDYAVNGLYKKTGFPGFTSGSTFGGVQETASLNGNSYLGYAPVFLKYSVGTNVSNSNNSISLIDIGSGSLNISQSITSLSEYSTSGFGVVFAYYDQLNPNSTTSFGLPAPSTSRTKRILTQLPLSYPINRTVGKVEIR